VTAVGECARRARRAGLIWPLPQELSDAALELRLYGPRPRRQKGTDPFLPYLCERLTAFPGLTAVRLWRELRERAYAGGYTAVKRAVRNIRPDPVAPFEVRFETPPGEQAQVDLARFEVEFTDEPGVTRIVWLFFMVLGYSRLIWARFVVHQDLQSVLRCHIAALEAIGGAPREILYDSMKTAVIGEDLRRRHPRSHSPQRLSAGIGRAIDAQAQAHRAGATRGATAREGSRQERQLASTQAGKRRSDMTAVPSFPPAPVCQQGPPARAAASAVWALRGTRRTVLLTTGTASRRA